MARSAVHFFTGGLGNAFPHFLNGLVKLGGGGFQAAQAFRIVLHDLALEDAVEEVEVETNPGDLVDVVHLEFDAGVHIPADLHPVDNKLGDHDAGHHGQRDKTDQKKKFYPQTQVFKPLSHSAPFHASFVNSIATDLCIISYTLAFFTTYFSQVFSVGCRKQQWPDHQQKRGAAAFFMEDTEGIA